MLADVPVAIFFGTVDYLLRNIALPCFSSHVCAMHVNPVLKTFYTPVLHSQLRVKCTRRRTAGIKLKLMQPGTVIYLQTI